MVVRELKQRYLEARFENRHREALEALRQLEKYVPPSPKTHDEIIFASKYYNQLACTLKSLGRLDEAKEAFEKAQKLDPFDTLDPFSFEEDLYFLM
jgi:tetratricopeptide (TPR) repeat protein